jgi:subtilisin family serine protease
MMPDNGNPGPGYVRVLAVADRGKNDERAWLRGAAEAFLANAHWTPPPDIVLPSEFVLDKSFGALALGLAAPFNFDFADSPPDKRLFAETLLPKNSVYFAIRVYVKPTGHRAIPQQIGDWHLYSDPGIAPSLTCSTDPAVGSILDVRSKLDIARLCDNGLTGCNVAVALVDSGIYLQHLTRADLFSGQDQSEYMEPKPKYPLPPRTDCDPPVLVFDAANSWKSPYIASPPGAHRIGHGTMCAYNVLAIAPNATLLDYPSLIARPPGDHTAQGTVSAASQAYAWLISFWVDNVYFQPTPKYHALVVNNSWGILHPSEDLFPPGSSGRFIDNPRHLFHFIVRLITHLDADVVFAAGNGGLPCPAPPFLHATTESIRGANAYSEVLTVAGCDVNDDRVGYSSQGPAITMLPLPTPNKPDITAYTHFLGSQVFGEREPDRGTSTACPITAGCIAALRTKLPAISTAPGVKTTTPAKLFEAIRETARRPIGGPKWNPDYGYGIIDPVAAGQYLQLNIP